MVGERAPDGLISNNTTGGLPAAGSKRAWHSTAAGRGNVPWVLLVSGVHEDTLWHLSV